MTNILDKIPPNTKIYPEGNISSWNGYLAVVYRPHSSYDFDPEKMTKKYHVYYVIDKNNRRMRADENNRWMVGGYIIDAFGAKMVKNPWRAYTHFALSNSHSYLIKTSVKNLNDVQLYKYTGYLKEKLGYIDASSWNISKKAWKIVFKKGLDELYKADERQGDKVYEFVNFYFEGDRDESEKVKRIKGVFAYYKSKEELRYVIKNG